MNLDIANLMARFRSGGDSDEKKEQKQSKRIQRALNNITRRRLLEEHYLRIEAVRAEMRRHWDVR